jgi:hypothetical protein
MVCFLLIGCSSPRRYTYSRRARRWPRFRFLALPHETASRGARHECARKTHMPVLDKTRRERVMVRLRIKERAARPTAVPKVEGQKKHVLSASYLTSSLSWATSGSLVMKPYCTSTHLSTHRGPTGPRRRIEALTEHLFCEISRTAGSCAYRLHSMPVAPQVVLPCAAQPPGRLLIGRTSLLLFLETDQY